MTPKEMYEYVQFMVWTIPLLMKPGDTLMDELNLHIKYFKVVDILTCYIPTNPTKDKEPMLNKNKNKLKQGPVEREKSRKKDEKGPKRLMKQVPVTFYSCNANHITNKMPTLVHDTLKERLDVIHITEAGLKQQKIRAKCAS